MVGPEIKKKKSLLNIRLNENLDLLTITIGMLIKLLTTVLLSNAIVIC